MEKKEVLSSVRAEKKEKPKAKPAANSIYRRSQTKQNVAMNLLGSLKSFYSSSNLFRQNIHIIVSGVFKFIAKK